MRKRSILAVTSVVAEAYGAVTWLGMRWGSTRAERRRALVSDALIPDPMIQTDHAVSIDAPKADVWPWLVQMGWGRAGWYTYRWVDRLLFPANGPSADEILPRFQSLDVGDEVPDGPPSSGCGFTVDMIQRESLLVLRSHSHLPPRPRDGWMDWTWTYVLCDTPDGGTRLHLRSRLRLGPRRLAWLYRAAIGSDYVMGRSHLLGIKSRAESHRGAGLVAVA